MNDIKCPYCSKNFIQWISVRKHVSNCDKNNYNYIITLEYGPISYEELSSITYREFKHKYPNIPASTTAGISKNLLKRGITSWKSMDKETIKEAFIKFYKKNNRPPTSRDCYKEYYLPTDFNCKQLFGSFNKALNYAGFESNNSGFGINTYGLDGKKYLSTLEALFVNKYLYGKYTYEYEKPYPSNPNNRISDFYIKELDLYIEVAGGLRPEVIKEKIDFCIKNNLNIKIIYPKDIYKDKVTFMDQ